MQQQQQGGTRAPPVFVCVCYYYGYDHSIINTGEGGLLGERAHAAVAGVGAAQTAIAVAHCATFIAHVAHAAVVIRLARTAPMVVVVMIAARAVTAAAAAAALVPGGRAGSRCDRICCSCCCCCCCCCGGTWRLESVDVDDVLQDLVVLARIVVPELASVAAAIADAELNGGTGRLGDLAACAGGGRTRARHLVGGVHGRHGGRVARVHGRVGARGGPRRLDSARQLELEAERVVLFVQLLIGVGHGRRSATIQTVNGRCY